MSREIVSTGCIATQTIPEFLAIIEKKRHFMEAPGDLRAAVRFKRFLAAEVFGNE